MQGNINIPDSNITSALTFRNLVLMNMQQLTNFPYIEKDFDALTDYELLCLVVKYLNDVIANQNEQNDSITNMYNAFLQLQNYVNSMKDDLETAFNNLDNYVRYYFDNLDVQDEIDHKIDEMVEDGTMEELLSHMYKYNYNYINLESYFGENITFTEALTTALTECNTYNKNLVIPHGNYELTSSININSAKVDGNGSTITYNGDDTYYCITGTNIELKNLTVDLNNKSYSLIENKHYESIKMDNVNVTNGKTTTSENDFSLNAGIYLDGKDVVLTNVSSNYNKGHGFIINPSVSGSVYLLDKITCNYNGDGTTNISHGLVHVTRSYGSNYKQLSILNSTSNNNKQSGLAIHQAQNVSVVNCVCNSNGEHGLVLQDGQNGSVSNSQFNSNAGCGVRIQGDFSTDDELTGYLNSCVSNCIINGTYGIGISNNVNKCTITNNIVNVTRYSVYVSRGQTNEHDSKNIIIKDNYLYSTDNSVKSDVVTYGPVENLLIENYCNGELNSTTRYYGNGVTQNLAPKYYGDISNIVVDPTNLVSTNWSIFGTNDSGVVTSNSGGYYVGQYMNVSKNTDYISIRLKVDAANSNETELGYTIELYDASSSLATVISRKFLGGYTDLNQTLKISDVTNVTEYTRIRIRIIGTAGKHIKPIYCYMNQSSMLPIIETP